MTVHLEALPSKKPLAVEKAAASLKKARSEVGCLSAFGRLVAVVCRLLPSTCCGCIECCRPLRCGGPKTYARAAKNLRRTMQGLGPAFVKLGQAMAAREDFLTAEAAAELRHLCDAVPAFPREAALRVLVEDLGQLSKLNSLPAKPVAAASLGQVYKMNVDGHEVALKIQRPGLRESMVVDLVVISALAGVLRKFVRCCCAASVDPVRVMGAWAATLWEELDYLHEADSMEIMRNGLVANKRVPGLVIPAVYREFTASRVLATEWVAGIKVTQKLDAITVSHLRIGIEAYSVMFMDLGVVHADPHAGNIIVTENGICLLDYGMCIRVPEDHRWAWARCIVYMIKKDYNKTLDNLQEIGFFPADCPRAEVLPVMSKIWEQLVASGSDIKKRKALIRNCFTEFKTLALRFDFDLPDYYLALLRALLTLEGIALSADVEFDIFQAIFPVALRIVQGAARERVQGVLSDPGSRQRLKTGACAAATFVAVVYSVIAVRHRGS